MPPIVPIADIDADAVERLLDRAFGADRHGRTAYRIRENMPAIAALSFAVVERGAPIGTIQCWPIGFERDDGGATPLVMVGPVAVEPALQRGGIGRRLTAHALAAADRAGADALMLIGDPEYYGRFGFSAERTGGWRVPGPVERRRLLARGDGAPGGAGMLGPRIAVRA